ncbi:MAG TPA: arginine--tRNA ligase, partial [Phnomibacter sp.]|nr:arginine--tRNA ligase [Phnomibacter sp.]
MMQTTLFIKQLATQGLHHLFGITVPVEGLTLNQTKPEFEGDFTVVLFPFVKQARLSPDALGQQLGAHMQAAAPDAVAGYQVIKGFLNITLSDAWWHQWLQEHAGSFTNPAPANGQKVMVEFSSPNTNKPLHLGHLRNIFLGWSAAEILKATGHEVITSCVVNDRGVHICKSMLAWQKFGQGATPQSTGIKGDHLVGDYYVQFEKALRQQTAPLYEQLLSEGSLPTLASATAEKASQLAQKLKEDKLPLDKKAELSDALKEIARNATPLMEEVRQMLVLWEQGHPQTLELWRTMNQWVYEGFDATYQRLGCQFDKMYYESQTYLLGKDLVEEGLARGVFYKKTDGSVWIDLTQDGLDEKLVLRADGTSVYITQDIGLAQLKYADYHIDRSVYVIADEQNYHMQVLKLICQKLDMPFANGIYHQSYGMVELPSGRMKSREGTVVDADDICDEMEKVAASKTEELGKVQHLDAPARQQLHHTLGMGALKFFLLRVDPKKRMVFNPEESIDFHGFTGPFVQYTYARTQSVMRQMEQMEAPAVPQAQGEAMPLLVLEKEIIKQLEQYAETLA